MPCTRYRGYAEVETYLISHRRDRCLEDRIHTREIRGGEEAEGTDDPDDTDSDIGSLPALMQSSIPLMEDPTSTLRIEGTRELDDLCLDRSDGREEHSDDREVSELFPEEFLCEGEDDIRIVLGDLSITESEEDKYDEYEKKEDQEYHGEKCRTSRSMRRISSLFGEIHRDIPAIVEKYGYERPLDKCRK